MIKLMVSLSAVLFALSLHVACAQHSRVSHGQHVFKLNQCTNCHGKDGTSPFNLTTRLDSLSDDELREFIKDPASFGNRRMPAFKTVISESDLDALILYLRTLPERRERKARIN